MRMNRLGRSGLFVSELCLGTMTFGGGNEGVWGSMGNLGAKEATELLKIAIDGGINFIDTANVYGGGASEEITGQAIRKLGLTRDSFVLATKAFAPMGEGSNQGGASRYHLMEACKSSLLRLGLDHIDLYQIHGFDRATPVEETLDALDALVRDGHIRYVGVSNWAAWQITKALGIASARHLAPIISLQAYYTIAGRDVERELVPMLVSEQVGLMVWSPLAGGFLSGKYDRNVGSSEGRRVTYDFPPVDKERGWNIIDAMKPLAAAKNVSVAQIALAWLLHQDVVSSVIVGATRSDQLADNIASAWVSLTPDELASLDAVSKLPREYPHWMMERQDYRARQLLRKKSST